MCPSCRKMIGNWLKRKVQRKTAEATRDDLQRFVWSLRGATADELGAIVAVATTIRLRMADAGSFPAYALTLSGYDARFQLKLANLVRAFQKMDQLSDAAGAMVWLHTVRALGCPEARELGREMWSELRRGFTHAEEALAGVEALTQREVPAEAWEAYAFVPADLGPAQAPRHD
jgi:hypothetical protein